MELYLPSQIKEEYEGEVALFVHLNLRKDQYFTLITPKDDYSDKLSKLDRPDNKALRGYVGVHQDIADTINIELWNINDKNKEFNEYLKNEETVIQDLDDLLVKEIVLENIE